MLITGYILVGSLFMRVLLSLFQGVKTGGFLASRNSTRRSSLSLAVLMSLLVFYACDSGDNSPKSSAGPGQQSEWQAYCGRQVGFSINYPAGMELTAKPPQITAEGKFNLLEWRVSRSEWFIVLHVHEPAPDTRAQPLKKWLEDVGGNLEETNLKGNVPALSRTSLFEAIFEKSVFFREISGDRVVEIRLVVPKIVDWMGPTVKVEPQYRNQERIFDSMVESIRVGECR